MIEYDDFNLRPFISDYLFADNYLLAPGDLKDGISFEESVNDGEELTFGSCVAGSLKFTVDNSDGNAPEIVEKEYCWKKAVQKSVSNLKSFVRSARPVSVCANGNVVYVASKTGNYLSMWDNLNGTMISAVDASIAPAQAVESVVMYRGTLYALYSKTPYASAYSVSGNVFSKANDPNVTEFQKKQIKRIARNHFGYTVTDSEICKYTPVVKNQVTESFQETRSEWLDMGYFLADKPEKLKETKISVTAYDRLIKFDLVVDAWLDSLSYPVTLLDMLNGLCNVVGVETVTTSFLNSNWTVKGRIDGENVTGRTILQYIAEAACGFCRMRPDGKLELVSYTDTGLSIDNSIYNSIETAEFFTDLIDRVQLRVTENDIGVVVGTGTNALVIENNLLLYGETDAELRPCVTNIYDAVSLISYQPYTLKMFQNPKIRAGDILTVTTRSGDTVAAYVMSRTLQGGIDTYEAVGNQKRSTQGNSVNSMIQSLRGKVHELKVTVDEFSSTITDMEGNVSSISQNISEIRLDINNSYVSLTDTDGLTVKAGGFRMINPSGDTVVEFDSGGTAYFSGDIEGSTISGSHLYFGSGLSGGELYGWSGKPSNDTSIRTNAVTLEADTSLVLYAPKGVSVAATDPKQVAIGSNAGPGALNVYGDYGIWCESNCYCEGFVRGSKFSLGGVEISSWDKIVKSNIPEYPGISEDFFIESPKSGAVYKLIFKNGLLFDWQQS